MKNELTKLREEIIECSCCQKMVESRREVMGKDHYAIPFNNINVDAKYVFVGIAPGRLNFDRSVLEEREVAFGKGSGSILRDVFRDLNLDENLIHITNICKCSTPKDKKFRPLDVYTCVEKFLLEELCILKPLQIFVMGRDAEKYFKEYISDFYNYTFINHPAMVLRGFMKYEDYLQQIKENVIY